MEHLLKILLLEDEQDVCERFQAEIDLVQDMELLDSTNDAAQALELAAQYHPDVIIVDLELHFGKGNGLLFLDKLKERSLEPSPYILVTTNNSSNHTYAIARELGADFIMHKHQEDYSEKHVIDFLRMMQAVIQSQQTAAEPRNATSETPEQRHQRLRRMVTAEMDKVGINPKSVGYQYLIEGILLSVDQPRTCLTAVLSKVYDKTAASVERAMQNAINRAWRTTDIDELLQYYTAKINSSRGVPTIAEFVGYYANKLRNEC